PTQRRANAKTQPPFRARTISASIDLTLKGLADNKHTLPVPRRRNRLPGDELVHDAVGLLHYGKLLEDVDRSDFRDVLQMRAAAGAVVRAPDFDDPQAPHGLRDEIQEGAIFDFVLDDHAVLLEDSDVLR